MYRYAPRVAPLFLRQPSPRWLSNFGLTHVDKETLAARMVDVSHKVASHRQAHARAVVQLPASMADLLPGPETAAGRVEIFGKKGPVFSTAIVAGVMAAKRTAELIPFCHQVALDDCSIDIAVEERSGGAAEPIRLTVDCRVKTNHRTGVEMEAMVGASTAALCVYDMLKARSHDIQVLSVQLVEKTGGKTTFRRE
ncbi:MoaC family-domain-containing protein [Ochromonadaceae sp. CCMP2298]|nr:MoaC family-domain-containing protein [Ochromonadaceae sp. CCMP2298]|mmetsp:Transcript_21969/g.48821  ORF Transcript_21969/g.48821 Transcript_21969/m.48821 type:complete len:196 (-) Transcript_21969:33-620(-)